ncbi:MAG: methyltransferase, TIGR04325 family [Sediminibacterium sp.]
MKYFFNAITPPLFKQLVRRFTGSWQGNYQKWEDAAAEGEGYDTPEILYKVKEALLQVKEGKALFERDSVLFYSENFNYPLLASLLFVANKEKSNLHVVDFGGSLGSTYFQNRKVLREINNISWSVVEQEEFVSCGKEYFEDEKLKFYRTVENCLMHSEAQTLLLSSVIQYIPDPLALIKQLLDKKFKYIIIDRTPFFNDRPDRITLQTVPTCIYKASYPCRIFNKPKFLDHFLNEYDVTFSYESSDVCNLNAVFEGFLLTRKDDNNE